MLLRLFKTQEPFNLIILLFIAVGIRIPYLLDSSPIPYFHYNEPFSTFLFHNFESIWGLKTTNVLITTLIYYLLSLWFNKVINDFTLLHKNTLIPSLVFVIITSIFPTFFTLDAAILILFFQIWMFIRLFRLYKTQNATMVSFDVGIIVAIASLFYFPSIAWILLVWISLLIFRPFYWREWAASILGCLTPYLFVAFFYYWSNRWEDFIQIWRPLRGTFWQINVFPHRGDYLPLIPIIFILIIAFNKYRENFYKNVVQVRKSQQILIVSIFVTAFSFYIKPSFSINHFILLALPLTVFISYYFIVAQKAWFSELLIVLLIFSCIIFQLI